jgi:hypothetical protein
MKMNPKTVSVTFPALSPSSPSSPLRLKFLYPLLFTLIILPNLPAQSLNTEEPLAQEPSVELPAGTITEAPEVITPEAVTTAGLAHDMDVILASNAVTWAQAARFVLPAAGFAADSAQEAFEAARVRLWLPKNAQLNGYPDFADLSFLVMKAFDISGGLMYRIIPNPRYSYREMVYRGIVRFQQHRSWKVSGFALITVISSALTISGID